MSSKIRDAVKLKRAKWKGKRSELRQVKRMEKMGWQMIRVPTSASGTTILPDLIGFHPERKELIAVEWKAHTRYVYLNKNQLEKCIKFLEMFKGLEELGVKLTPLIGCRFGTGRGTKTVWKTITPEILNLDIIRVDLNSESDWAP